MIYIIIAKSKKKTKNMLLESKIMINVEIITFILEQ